MKKTNKKKENFIQDIFSILEKDCTQSCENSEGTKISILNNYITIECGISAKTLRDLMATNYMIQCNDKGQVEITNLKLWEDGE